MKLVQGPYTGEMLRHPLFGREVRGMKPAWQPSQFRHTSRRVVLVVHAVIFAAWVLLALLIVGPGRPGELNTYVSRGMNLIIGAAVLLDAILDFVCLQGAVKTISGEITAGRWDLLRLTALSDRGIVRAKHAGARLRVWRATMIVASVRAAAVTLLLFNVLILPYVVFGENPSAVGLIDSLISDPFGTLLTFAGIGITFVVYIVEPFWRAQAMTALGMVLSAYIQSVPLALLAGLGVIFAVWLVQVIIVIALVVGLGIGLGAVFSPLLFGSSLLAFALYLMVACLVTALTIYGFYMLVQTWSLRRVWNRIQNAN